MWVFTITDYTFGSTVATVIDNPMGWDETKIVIKRKPEFHGMFFDYPFDTLKFTNDALDILEAAYIEKGIEAYTTLTIEWDCDNHQVLYIGRFDYKTYKKVCDYRDGGGCSIEMSLENNDGLMKLWNRYDQKVNLDTLTDFAGNSVDPYNYLGTEITLDAKSIQKTDDYWTFLVDNHPFVDWDETVVGGGLGTAFAEYFTLPFGDTPNGSIHLQEFHYNPYDDSSPPIFTVLPLVKYTSPVSIPTQIIPGETATYNFHINFGFTIDVDMGSDQVTEITMSIFQIKNGAVSSIVDFSSVTAGVPPTNHFIWSNFIDHSWSVSMAKDDHFTYYLRVLVQTDKTSGSGTFPCTLTIKDADGIDYSYLTYNALSKLPSTPCKSYLINESFARTVEAITDSEMTVKSDEYGRPDSQPYASDDDGCGALKFITNGLFIRQALIQGNEPLMTVSLKDLFEGCKSIDCIGMGMEEDTDRPYYYGVPYQRIRIEQFEYFYNTTVVMRCLSVEVLEIGVMETEFISIFKFGYAKYEGEEYNGIDEFLSQREYRSSTACAKQTLDQVCKFVASGYAIEITRRKSTTTKDWRFDNDIFIVCVEREYGIPFIVEQGNIDLDANIIDPPTIYNYRISPWRNALKWFKILFAQFNVNSTDAEYKFTNGTGNYFAEGVLLNGCVEERTYAPNSESGDLNYFSFQAYTGHSPIWKNERVKFKYSMTVYEFNVVKANPYGQIEYSFANGDILKGWIDEINYLPDEGNAEFVLIPER